jgi:uncharacterized protein (TIGR03086 family)
MDGHEPLVLLARALDEVGRLIAGTRGEQADLPTPCASWTVGQLAGHVMSDLDNFATAVRGGKPDWSRPPASPGDDWPALFAARRSDLDDAWAGADLTARVPTMTGADAPLLSRADQQIAELAVHGWDLARATGQRSELDGAVAEHGLGWARRNLKPEFRGREDEHKAFGPEVPIAADAPALDRLAAWFGRDPAVAPGGR